MNTKMLHACEAVREPCRVLDITGAPALILALPRGPRQLQPTGISPCSAPMASTLCSALHAVCRHCTAQTRPGKSGWPGAPALRGKDCPWPGADDVLTRYSDIPWRQTSRQVESRGVGASPSAPSSDCTGQEEGLVLSSPSWTHRPQASGKKELAATWF